MQYHNIEAANLGRRGFLGLAGLGIAAAAFPAPLWAMAEESYPTVRAKIAEFVGQKKSPMLWPQLAGAAQHQR